MKTENELSQGSSEISVEDVSSGCSLKPVAYSSSLPLIHVLAGALFDSGGRVLLAERPAGKHMAGRWEFPGGKRSPGETPFEALARELMEELGVTVLAAEPLISYEHEYSDRRVLLDLWRVTGYTGTPESREGQKLEWVPLGELGNVDLLEADRPMIEALQKGCGL